MAKKRKQAPPKDITDIRKEISDFFAQKDDEGRTIGNAKYGVYAFYDYDGEPIYVGQTREILRGRIGRHLTNQRTDAVAMNVLDPLEVAEIEVWPIYLEKAQDAKEVLGAAEYTVFKKLLAESPIGAVLNEDDIPPAPLIDLPPSFRKRVVPEHVFDRQKHPDVRIARRASTLANLARVISEREVSPGLRRTLLTQARRLELLASKRLSELGMDYSFGGTKQTPGDHTGH